jgi:uncharacterized UPF0160 family protein
MIITHSDSFHCDDVMACAILKLLYPEDNIIRTRDMNIINNSDAIVLDVGLIYDHEKKRYDHHQESFNDTFSKKYTTPMSSCGLIWKHYGLELINKYNPNINANFVHSKIYKTFIYAIDCNDNGISNMYKNKIYVPTEIHNIVGMFNSKKVDNFEKCLQVCMTIFEIKLNSVIDESENYIKYLDTFKIAFDSRIDEEYIIIDTEFYIDPYLALHDKNQKIKFVILKREENYYKI